MKDCLSLVLGGGRGTRLDPLTRYRAKPAVPLAGKYRLIDIPLSNCINSGLNRVYVLTQFLSVSLHRHLRQTYRFDQFNGGFVELLAAQQTSESGSDWYQGTADAVRKNLRYLEQPDINYVLILSGDQLYRMDYRDLLRTHQESRAQVTIAGLPVSGAEAKSLGIMRLNETGRVVGFLEKPQTQEELDIVRMKPEWIDRFGFESRGRDCMASMGIYLFNRDFLVDVLNKTSYADFGREVFPASIRTRHVQMHTFDGYWEDIGTIRAFYEANLALAGDNPPFRFAVPGATVYSRARFLPPVKIESSTISHSMIADGCTIRKGAVIENSVIGLRCHIGENATIRNSVLLGADDFDHDAPGDTRPPLGVGAGSVIEGAIVDKNCRIGRNVRIVNQRDIMDSADADDCVIRDGVPVVIKDSVLPDGWTLENVQLPTSNVQG